MKLQRRYVEKPWGRTRLPPQFRPPDGKRIGEVWFTDASELPLLAKYIFTSERLSIQVHPQQKTECWYVLEAEPDAMVGLGLTREVSRGELRAAALDGSIERMVDWRQVRAGDFYLVPPGTIHAIGSGLSLFEFQQNSDVTYRFYDYGRVRDLHVDDAVAAACTAPYPPGLAAHVVASDDRTLVEGPAFRLVHSHEDKLRDRQRWVIPIEGRVRSGEDVAEPGECLLLAPDDDLACEGARMLIGAMP
jgi:mannose-6-phosphate isomerase